jgi:HSP20 family protein
MSNKSFTFDMGRIMDDALEWAQEFGESFQHGMRGFPGAEGLHERLRERFKCYEDVYPHYPYPPANIYLNTDRSLVFEVALAGFEEKGITLEFRGDYLYLSAKAPQPAQSEEGVQFFKRRLKLKDVEEQRYYVPADKFEQARVEARFRNGLLRVRVPAKEGAVRPDGIKVNIVSEDQPGEPTGA